MDLTLNSYRSGIQDATKLGSGQGFLVYSESEKGGLKLDLTPQETSQTGGMYNVFVRSKLLNLMRESLSASNHSGKTVDDFMAKAERRLFGSLGVDGRYGVGAASRKLECATVKQLLDEFDRISADPQVVNIGEIKRNLKPVPKTKNSVPKNSGTGSIGTTGPQKTSEVGKPKIDFSERTELDLPQDELTAAQRELRTNCPNVTSRQRSAVLKLDTQFPAGDLGIKSSVAKGLEVKTVRPSKIEGFLECHLEGPNGKVDVLVDQAGVCSLKSRLSENQVEADCKAFSNLVAKDLYNSVGDPLDVAKMFAHSELKVATDLVKVLKKLSDDYADHGGGSVVGKVTVIGVMLNMLASTLRQLPGPFKSAGSPEKTVVACWKMLKLPEPAPKAKDPDLHVKFFNGLKQRLFDDYMQALNLGPHMQKDPSIQKDFLAHVMNFDDEMLDEDDNDEDKEVLAARSRLGKNADQTLLNAVTDHITAAQSITGLSYEARLKCVRDPHYVPKPDEYLVMPKLNYRVDEKLDTVFGSLSGSITDVRGRYCNVTFTLDDGKTVSVDWPGHKNVNPGEMSKVFGNFKTKLKGLFTPQQIVQLAHYLNDSALYVSGMGMEPVDANASGELRISKDKNGNMKVEFKRPSCRLSGIDKICGSMIYLSTETTEDYVHRFTIGSDGMGKTDSITFEKNSKRSADVILYNNCRVSKGQLDFLDKVEKTPDKTLGLGALKNKKVVLIQLNDPGSNGVSRYVFRTVDKEGYAVDTINVNVDANGRIIGKAKIKKSK